ncbi:MAG: efflux RND transporter periplasmic adaptor subunit [Cyanobacteria bacterium P01_H01_bin.121]
MLSTHIARRTLTGTLLSVSLLIGACQSEEQAAQPQALPTKVQALQPATIEDSSEFVGNLKAVQRADVTAEIQGQIQDILVSSGDLVQAGTALIVLRPDQTVPQLAGAQAGILQAQAARDQARAAQIATIEQLKVAQSQRDSAASNLELQQVNFERAKFLLEQGAIGEFDYDRAENALNISKNDLDVANDQVRAAEAAIAQAGATVNQAEAAIREAQASTAGAAVSVGLKQIEAPITGYLADLPLRVGDYLTVGQPVVTITQVDEFELRIAVPSQRISELRAGLPVELIDPNTQQSLATGGLSFVSPTVDPSGQVVQAKAKFPNVDGNLRDGQYVEARVIWSQQPGILIPTTAISRISGKSFVFLVDQAQSEQGEAQTVAKLTPVELGDIQESSYQVLSGLEAGDSIAVSNLLKLRDGAPIQPES